MKGILLIAAERGRQGTAGEYQGEFQPSELMTAAGCYMLYAQSLLKGDVDAFGVPTNADTVAKAWPWRHEDFDPGLNAVEMLARAGALIAAEIDRHIEQEG